MNNNNGVNIGDILTLICGVFYALHIIFVARTGQNGDPILLQLPSFPLQSEKRAVQREPSCQASPGGRTPGYP